MKFFTGLKKFILLWSTQSLSALGSSMTSFALIIWSYQQKGSALTTALLSVCSYAPYVMMSVFAGALSDRWSKKATMLVCDSIAALSTLAVLLLLKTDLLEVWHLYVLNAVNGLMNTVQKPSADVTITLVTPEEHYQKASSLQSFSNSLVTILTPMLATAFLSFWGIDAVFVFDLATFAVAFSTLLFFIEIPAVPFEKDLKEPIFKATKAGLRFLRENRGILDLILFLAAINFTASMYNTALPAMLLSRNGGSELALGIVNTATGCSMLAGSVISTFLKTPKSRVRMICNTLLISMSTENFFLAFGRTVPVWCIGAILGWVTIPIMNANMDVLFRSHIPLELQGRVYSVRNTFQFFTIPIGYFVGGILVDKVFEPFMARQNNGMFLHVLFGYGKGSGAAFLFAIIAFAGIATCLLFRRDPHIWELEQNDTLLE